MWAREKRTATKKRQVLSFYPLRKKTPEKPYGEWLSTTPSPPLYVRGLRMNASKNQRKSGKSWSQSKIDQQYLKTNQMGIFRKKKTPCEHSYQEKTSSYVLSRTGLSPRWRNSELTHSGARSNHVWPFITVGKRIFKNSLIALKLVPQPCPRQKMSRIDFLTVAAKL